MKTGAMPSHASVAVVAMKLKGVVRACPVTSSAR